MASKKGAALLAQIDSALAEAYMPIIFGDDLDNPGEFDQPGEVQACFLCESMLHFVHPSIGVCKPCLADLMDPEFSTEAAAASVRVLTPDENEAYSVQWEDRISSYDTQRNRAQIAYTFGPATAEPEPSFDSIEDEMLAQLLGDEPPAARIGEPQEAYQIPSEAAYFMAAVTTGCGFMCFDSGGAGGQHVEVSTSIDWLLSEETSQSCFLFVHRILYDRRDRNQAGVVFRDVGFAVTDIAQPDGMTLTLELHVRMSVEQVRGPAVYGSLVGIHFSAG